MRESRGIKVHSTHVESTQYCELRLQMSRAKFLYQLLYQNLMPKFCVRMLSPVRKMESSSKEPTTMVMVLYCPWIPDAWESAGSICRPLLSYTLSNSFPAILAVVLNLRR